MRNVKLGNPEIAKVCAGQSAPQDANAFGDSGYAFIRAGSLEHLCEGGDTKNLEHINAEMAKKYRLKLFPKDTVTFAKSGMSAKIGRVYKLKEPAYIVSHLAAIIPQDNLDADYLTYFLKTNPPANLIPNDAYPSIRLSEIENISIDLPPHSEQRRIAAILDKVDAICRKRKECIKMLDELVKARFVEMFGDLKKYHQISFGKICIFIRNGVNIKQYPYAKGIPITRIETLTEDKFNINRLGYADLMSIDKYKNYELLKGDILISHINSRAYLGRAVQYRGELETPIIHGMNLLCARLTGKFNATFIEWFSKTNEYKKYISKITKNAINQSSFNITDFKNLQIPIIDLKLQNKFDIFVSRIIEYKSTMQSQLQEAETLKAALMQQYFSQPSQEKICA